MCLPQNSPHAPRNYSGRHSAAKTPPHCHIIHTQLCGQAGVCVMFSWRSPVAACGSLRSRKFPSELSGSLTNPHTHPPTPPPSRSPKRTLPSLSAQPTPLGPSSAPCCCLSFLLLRRRCRRCSLRVASALFLCTRRTCATSTATQTQTSTATASWLIVSGGKC